MAWAYGDYEKLYRTYRRKIENAKRAYLIYKRLRGNYEKELKRLLEEYLRLLKALAQK